MKLGILSDIHEAVELLEAAIERFEREEVEQIVVLGDVFETGPRIDATVEILRRTGAVGVFGNHDYGLSNSPSDYVRERFSAPVLAYMGSLLPRMEIEGSLFAHREPWLDCSDLCQVWHVDEEELPPESLARSFEAVANPAIFIGHFHRWAAFTRSGPLAWNGNCCLTLREESQTLVVVHAVCDGHAATFETSSRVLTPLDLYADRPRPARRPLPPLVTG